MERTCYKYSASDMEVEKERVWTANIQSRPEDEKEVNSHEDEQDGFIYVLTYDYTRGSEPWRYWYPDPHTIPVSEYKEQKSTLILDVLCETSRND